jgi:hypothetical protein
LVLDDPNTAAVTAAAAATTTHHHTPSTAFSADADATGGTSTTAINQKESILRELIVFTTGGHLTMICHKVSHVFHHWYPTITESFTITTATTTMIQNKKGKSRCMPRDLLRTLQRWETQLPQHSIFFHDDDAVVK